MKNTAFLAVVLVVASVALLTAPAGPAQSAQSKPGEPALKTAEQAFANIQVLKGVPEFKLYDTMAFISASLGVQCTFCHDENAYEKDEKKTKQKARQMMRMQMAINKENFDGHNEVTCF